MDGKIVGQLTIFYMREDEFEDTGLKNRCLIQTGTDYIAYVRDDAVRECDLLRICECREEPEDDLVAVFCQGIQTMETDYAGAFELLSAPIGALLFSRKLIRETGAYNERLSVQTDFELLCRLARQTDKCTLIGIDGRFSPVQTEAGADTYAYIIRHHMQQLHTLGIMDRIFTLFCESMQAVGLFPAFQRQIDLLLSDEKAYERIASQTAPFVVLRGDDTCMGVLQQFADDLCDALEDAGQAVIKVDDRFTEHDRLQNLVCKGVVGFQAAALEIDFFKNMHGPKFQFWFDYPLHSGEALRNLSRDYYILCQDADYAELIREYYHTPNAIQFPPAGRERNKGRQGCVRKQVNRGQERIYDIVFVGSCFEEEGDLPEGEEQSFYDYMLAHPQLTFEQGLRELLTQNGEKIEEDLFVNKLISLKPVRRRVIGHFRQAVISTILEAGFTLHVYGDSWKKYCGAGREHLVIHPQVTVEESLEELGKAKIGLNIMSWHKAGMTERVANIMLSGAVCLTDETAYLREHMENGDEIVCFGLDRLSELPDMIRRLLDNPGERERIADNAYQKASAEHTWKCRARQLMELAESSQSPKRLVLFHGELDTLNLFSDRLKQGFLDLGYEIFDFDLQQSTKSLGLLYEYMQESPVTAMIAFNSNFYGMTLPTGENMWEVLGIPCINIFVDHPYWYHNILMRTPATGIVLCIDRNHMDYVSRLYPDIPSNGFLAHGGTSLSSNHKPISERKTDVLYAGSLYADHIPQEIDFSAWHFPARQIYDRSVEHLLSHPQDTVEMVVEQQLLQAGIVLPDEELRRFISHCVYIERVVSSHYREQVVGSIARAGISLELYGDGWGGCDWVNLPNVHYGGRVAPEEILSMMEDSKIVLSTMPWFKDGSHERVFNAMLCGAVAVSETSRYLEEVLPSDAWISFNLSSESLSELPQRILDFLADERRLQEIASAGQDLAASAHTWEARAQELHRDLLSYL